MPKFQPPRRVLDIRSARRQTVTSRLARLFPLFSRDLQACQQRAACSNNFLDNLP